MNIEQHIPTLKTCKKLQKVGWKRETLMYIHECLNGSVQINTSPYTEESSSPKTTYCAPLLSELLDVLYNLGMFPQTHATMYGGNVLHLATANIYKGEERVSDRTKGDKNPAEAAAQLVLTLVENGVLTL